MQQVWRQGLPNHQGKCYTCLTLHANDSIPCFSLDDADTNADTNADVSLVKHLPRSILTSFFDAQLFPALAQKNPYTGKMDKSPTDYQGRLHSVTLINAKSTICN